MDESASVSGADCGPHCHLPHVELPAKLPFNLLDLYSMTVILTFCDLMLPQ